MMEAFLLSFFFFFFKSVNFPHHLPDVEAQIPPAGNQILQGAWSEICTLSAPPPKIAMESGISYPPPTPLSSSPPCQSVPRSALGCKDLKVKADGLA